MTKTQRELPARELRDHIITVVYGHDPQPARCEQPGHADAKAHQGDCEDCRSFHLWRSRMYRRFYERGLRLTFDEHEYHDPEPPRCLGHSYNAASRKVCQHCQARDAWQERRRVRLRRAGVELCFTDYDTLTTHLRKLTDAGMVPSDIARASGCAATTVVRALRPPPGSRYVSTAVAHRLLQVPLPERRLTLVPNAAGARRRQVDATGTRRRIQIACRGGHSLESQSRRLGWAESTIWRWLTVATVPVEAADAVAEVFPALVTRKGGSAKAALFAERRAWPEARHFSTDNIDDPAYDPHTIVNSPTAVRRQVRALAWMGQGPDQVGEFIGEAPENVAIWLKGGPAPAYARHLVDAAFEALSGTFGPDDQAAQLARREGWASPLAWYGIDMSDPNLKPQICLARRARKTDYPLESQVHLAVMGRITVEELFKPEKIRAVWILHRAGWSDRRIAAWLRWNTDGDLDAGRAAVNAFRYREGIVGFGQADDGLCNRDSIDGLIVTPSAA